MVYRVGDGLVYAVTGEGVAGRRLGPPPLSGTTIRAVYPQPTVFERATEAGARCLTLGRELDHLPGTWAPALLRGSLVSGVWCQSTERHSRPVHRHGAAALAEQAADPRLLADTVAADVTVVLAEAAPRAPVLLWVYVNLDDHIHRHGYDAGVLAALRRLDAAASQWADRGWTVLAHSDHGQVPVRPDPALAAAWAEVDNSDDCELPSGGAGRARWLYPRPGREDAVRARLAAALGEAAVVLPTPELALSPHLALPPERVGAVLALAASPAFPLPDPGLRYEHGGLDVEEMVVPLGAWRPTGATAISDQELGSQR
jgi:hypothetical protein